MIFLHRVPYWLCLWIMATVEFSSQWPFSGMNSYQLFIYERRFTLNSIRNLHFVPRIAYYMRLFLILLALLPLCISLRWGQVRAELSATPWCTVAHTFCLSFPNSFPLEQEGNPSRLSFPLKREVACQHG